MHSKFLVGKPPKTHHFEDIGFGKGIKSKFISNKWDRSNLNNVSLLTGRVP
jgi:hypothetical protein